jgi:hypothetical protein
VESLQWVESEQDGKKRDARFRGNDENLMIADP